MESAVRRPCPSLWAIAACLALAVVSLLLLPSAPTYDPYAWLVWGRDLAHGHLVTQGGGASWKPLPALITAVLSPLGAAAATAWVALARAGALLAVYMAYRLAARIAGRPAGLAAAASLLLVHEWVRRNAVGNAEGLMVALGLLAIDRHLDGRRGQAFALGVAAGLVRPEVWPFLLAYGLWLWIRSGGPGRAWIAALGLLVPLLWFGGDWIGSGHPFGASDRALSLSPTGPALGRDRAAGVLQEAWRMLPLPARVAIPAAVAGALVAWIRSRRTARPAGLTLALAGGALAWTAIVAAMTARGYPGLPRFLFMGSALGSVVAGAGIGWAVQAVVRALPAAVRRPFRPAIVLAVAACFAALAASDAQLLRSDAAAVETVAVRDDGLAAAVRAAGGGGAVLRCGHPYTGWFAVTALAWDLGVQVDQVHDRPHGRRPVVFVLDHGRPGLQSRLPVRHVREAEAPGGWDVVDRCPASS
jgi:hypothetical protein